MNLHNLRDESNASEQAAHVSVVGHLRLSLLWFSINFQSAALLPIVLPVQLLLFVTPGSVGNAEQATLLGWLATGGSLIALFIPPLIGALSDRTTGTLGRRRPYIALGAVIAVLGAVTLARPGTLAVLFGGLLLFQVGNGVLTGGYQGLLPDMVPAAQRGEASGYIGLMTILGNAGSLGLSAALLGAVTAQTLSAESVNTGTAFYYLLTGAVLIVGVLFTVFGVHETPLEAVSLARSRPLHSDWRGRFFAAWLAPWLHRNFRWVFLTRASVMLGLSLFMTFIEYYFASVTNSSDFVNQTAALAVLALAGAAGSALALGILSDHLRLGRVALVCIATGCMALAASGFLVLPTGTPLWPLGLLFGVGYGAYSSVDWALAVDVLPAAENAGKDMGIWSAATTLPAILAPLTGAIVLHFSGQAHQTALGYQLVFLLAALCMIAGAICIFLVRDEQQRH